MSKYTLPFALVTACSISLPAYAEFRTGGYVATQSYNVFRDSGSDTRQTDTYFEATAAYRTGTLEASVTYYANWDGDQNWGNQDFDENDSGPFVTLAYGNLSVSYGQQRGAGNLIPEDFFLFNDITSTDADVLRFDYHSENHAFAMSFETESDFDFEVGYVGNFPILGADNRPLTVLAGFEQDNQEGHFSIGRLDGEWGYLATLNPDFLGGDDANEFGVTVFKRLAENWDLAVNYAHTMAGTPEGLSAILNFGKENYSFKLEVNRDLEDSETKVELGGIYFFGERSIPEQRDLKTKDYLARFGY